MIRVPVSQRRQHRTIHAIVMSVLATLTGMSIAMAAEFVAGSEDIPLMTGLVAIEDAGMVFDSPAGRIVEGVYGGGADEDTVRLFYAETLPALGWRLLSDDRFEREGERLEIDYFGSGEDLTIRFTLAPQ